MLRSKSKSKRESKAASREKELQVSEEELDLSAAVAFRSGWRDENSVEVDVEGDVEGDVVEYANLSLKISLSVRGQRVSELMCINYLLTLVGRLFVLYVSKGESGERT